MRKRTVLASLAGAAIASLLAAGGASAAPSPAADPSIIGGSTVDSAPWGAQIYWDGGGDFDGFECSGTIIAADWVLTAQHCLNDGGGMHVKVGDVHFDQGTESEVDSTQADPNGDLLLLHLATPIDTTYMQLANADPATGDQNNIYGWGRTQDDSPPADQLKTATVQVDGTATDAFGGPAIDSKGVDGAAWHGDSGGPELNADGQQVGVCSTGENSGEDPNGTQQYASVASSRDWIQQTAGV